MTCQQIEELIPALAAGALSGASAAESLMHIEKCADCQASLREAVELFAVWQEPEEAIEFDVDLVTPVMRRISPGQGDPRVARRPEATSRRAAPWRRLAVALVPARPPSRLAPDWRSSMYHFGLSAGLALLLFHFGVFEKIGPAVTSLHALVVGRFQGWLAFASAVM